MPVHIILPKPAGYPLWFRVVVVATLGLLFANALYFIGPLNALITNAKEWQTVLAATIAIGAATIAYKGAMAKVGLNREIADRQEMRRKLAIYLKLEFALLVLSIKAAHAEKITSWQPVSYNQKAVSADDLNILEPPEIREAWEHLDAFPLPVIQQLRLIRVSIRLWQEAVESKDSAGPWVPEISSIHGDNPTPDVRQSARIIKNACDEIVAQLKSAIQQMSNG